MYVFEVRSKLADPEHFGFIAERCSQIVCGSRGVDAKAENCEPWWIEDSSKWQLDAGNNWWLRRVEGEDNKFEIAARYASDEVMKALVVFLEYVFK